MVILKENRNMYFIYDVFFRLIYILINYDVFVRFNYWLCE